MNYRERLKDKKRIVIKIGSSSLTHSQTGRINLRKLEVLVREICDLQNQGKDVVLVSSGAIAVGVAALGLEKKPSELKKKQACAAVGQARLMMIYQQLFSEYNHMAAQILMTKNTMVNNANRKNAENTFEELLGLNVIPIVNENDSISTYESQFMEKFGDNDTLSAVVAALIHADLLILLSDIDGLFTDDPNTNPEAHFIDVVENLDENLLKYGQVLHRKQSRNRGNGHKAYGCKNCNSSRSRYGDCQWKGLSHNPQDLGRTQLWNTFCWTEKRRILSS